MNHFQIFDIKEKFDINLSDLEDKYLKLQQQFHPDTAKDPIDAEINSILINKAYKILKNPISRGIHLLELKGININSEECIVKPTHENLMFIMNLREEISENKNDEKKIEEIRKEIKKLIEEEMLQASNFLSLDQYQEAAQKLIKIKYLDKIILDLKEI